MYKLSHYLLKDNYYELITDYMKVWAHFIPLTLFIKGVTQPFAVDFSYSKDGYSQKDDLAIFIEVASKEPIINGKGFFDVKKNHDYRNTYGNGAVKPSKAEYFSMKIIDGKSCYNVVAPIKVETISFCLENEVEIGPAGYPVPVLIKEDGIYRIKVGFTIYKQSTFKLVKE